MTIRPDTILWIYIILLFVGGLIGFFKAGSKVSLITSASFAAVLILCQLRIIFQPNVADIVLLILLVFFAVRLTKTKKFMPMGLMLIFTFAALFFRNVHI
ncbi:MAG TPA: TMEM14 family protein [Verrucomicrobiae bacterium]|nr:TMEM14 family protein [Verrucomicrobiae bacterium]